jgi:hypothetical protein
MTAETIVATLRTLRHLTRLEASITRQVMDPSSDPAWRSLLSLMAAEIARLDAELRHALDAAPLPPVTDDDVSRDTQVSITGHRIPERVH